MSAQVRDDETITSQCFSAVAERPVVVETPTILLVGVALLIQLALSGYSVLGGIALSGKNKVNPYVFALYREILASLLMTGVAVAVEGKDVALAPVRSIGAKGSTRTLLLFAAAGLASFGTVVGTVVALNFIPSDIFSMYQPTIPVFTTAIALCGGYESPNRFIFAGVTASVVGAVLVEIFNMQGSGAGNVLGNVVVIGQCIATAFLLVLTKPLTADWSPLVVTAGYYSIGSLFTVVVCVAAQLPRSDFFWTAPEPWGALAYSVFIATFFAYEAFSWLVQRASPTFTSAFIPMQPVFTIILNYLILGQGLGAPTAGAGALVIVGLFFTVFGKFRRDAAASGDDDDVDPAAEEQHPEDGAYTVCPHDDAECKAPPPWGQLA